MITIILPEYISDNFGDGIAQFFKIIGQVRNLPEQTPVTLDMTCCKFLTPFFLLPIALFIRQEKLKREIIIHGQDDYGCAEYLRHIHFEMGLKPEDFSQNEYGNIMNNYSDKSYIPIVDFPATRTNDNTAIRDKFVESINTLLAKQLNLKSNFKTGIMYLIDEAINNIVDHSKEERGFIFAQYYKSNSYVDVCIGDCGVSILGSYRQTDKQEIGNDRDAIISAANGLSTKDRPGAESRGFGISTSIKMLIKGLRGKYFLLSGKAFLIKTLEKEEIVSIQDELHWQGTIVALRIPYVGNSDFNPTDYYG